MFLGQRQRFREFEAIIKDIQSKRPTCSVALPQNCSEPAIKGHVIPEAKLKVIADSKLSVRTASPDIIKGLHLSAKPRRDGEDSRRGFERRAIGHEIMTRRFACATHDNQTFSLLENAAINWQDPRALALMSYRSVLAQLQSDAFFVSVYSRIKLAMPVIPEMEVQLQNCRERISLKRDFESIITNGKYDEWDYEVIDFQARPTVAASVVMNRRFTLDEYASLGSDIVLPAHNWGYKTIPIIINVCPDLKHQMAVVAYPKWAKAQARIMVQALDERDVQMKAALLSRTLLEESEIIMISDDFWQSISATRRSVIEGYFATINLLNDEAYDRPDFDPRPLNLFDIR